MYSQHAPDLDLAAEERAGGENHGAGRDNVAVLEDDADHLLGAVDGVLLEQQVLHRACPARTPRVGAAAAMVEWGLGDRRGLGVRRDEVNGMGGGRREERLGRQPRVAATRNRATSMKATDSSVTAAQQQHQLDGGGTSGMSGSGLQDLVPMHMLAIPGSIAVQCSATGVGCKMGCKFLQLATCLLFGGLVLLMAGLCRINCSNEPEKGSTSFGERGGGEEGSGFIPWRTVRFGVLWWSSCCIAVLSVQSEP